MGKVRLERQVTARLSYLTAAVFAGASACCGIKLPAGQRAASFCNSATSSPSFSSSSFRSSLTTSSSSTDTLRRGFSGPAAHPQKVHSVHSEKLWEDPATFQQRPPNAPKRAEVSTATLDLIRLDARGKNSSHFCLFVLFFKTGVWSFWSFYSDFPAGVKTLQRSTFHLK